VWLSTAFAQQGSLVVVHLQAVPQILSAFFASHFWAKHCSAAGASRQSMTAVLGWHSCQKTPEVQPMSAVTELADPLCLSTHLHNTNSLTLLFCRRSHLTLLDCFGEVALFMQDSSDAADEHNRSSYRPSLCTHLENTKSTCCTAAGAT